MYVEPDIAMIRIASEQHGVFTRKQALGAGHTSRMIDYRLSSERWELLHPRVYALGGAPATWERNLTAACYWCKGIAAGRAAGRLHQLPGCDNPPLEVLTTPSNKVMGRCGLAIHLTKRLPAEQIVRIGGIPSTSIERTLMDLCGQFDPRRAAIALDNALFRGLTTLGSLDYCLYLTARRGRNGCGVMRKLLKKRLTMSEAPNSPLETVIFEMFVESSLPMPELQLPIYDEFGRFVARPDFVYPDEKLVIEGHSKLWHSGALAQELDRERDRKLRHLGYQPIYLGWADATTHKERTLQMIERQRLLMQPRRAGLWPS